MKRLIFVFILFLPLFAAPSYSANSDPMPIGVVGLTHTHVHWILGRPNKGDIKIVGIVEPNKALAKRYTKQHGLSMSIVYDTLEEMLDKTHPVGVTAFGTIYDHLSIVKVAAPRGIHVMVEKPLAVNLNHAKQMQALAKKHNILLLTNYETTWYPTTHKTHEIVSEHLIGDIRKIVVHDGHKGPKKLGINKEFLDWLLDPVLNGGGAITDFGCYGANLMTMLMNGVKPLSVTAVTQNFQPSEYPNVDDEATIIVAYPNAQGIIQASWNWPIARKDMEVYGTTGYVLADNRHSLRLRENESEKEISMTLKERPNPLGDPFTLFRAVILGEITLGQYDLSSLANNMQVMEILEAAVTSAKTGKTVYLR